MKKITVVTVLMLAMLFAFSGVAYANFGPHGGYSLDTDACAGCHRAHTSFSELTWVDDTVAAAEHSALLISNATTMSEFCNVCHGNEAPGASTNVVSGIYDGGPSGPQGGDPFRWETNSTWNATLNGGGFERMPSDADPSGFMSITSSHRMDVLAGEMYPAWGQGYGAGNALPAATSLTCTNCHDVHGSSNYRLLKDYVNNNVVGGYISDYDPDPFVVSAEEGYPSVGWKKHEVGAAQMADYRPNYTSPEYATTNNEVDKGISGWCAACHEAYVVRNDVAEGQTYDYGSFLPANDTPLGAQAFHRHPVNVSLAGGDPSGYALGTSWLRSAVTTDAVIPLEARAGKDLASHRSGEWDYDDFMGCLTCHRAHGSAAVMTGYASAELRWEDGTLIPVPYNASTPATAGVDPNFTSSLLRTDNRGVCERCHNK